MLIEIIQNGYLIEEIKKCINRPQYFLKRKNQIISYPIGGVKKAKTEQLVHKALAVQMDSASDL